MMDWQAHNDAHSRQVFLAFKEALSPLMANVAPDWLLHHIEMRRSTESDTMDERVEIRLVIKPIGQARFADPDADLLTGHSDCALTRNKPQAACNITWQKPLLATRETPASLTH